MYLDRSACLHVSGYACSTQKIMYCFGQHITYLNLSPIWLYSFRGCPPLVIYLSLTHPRSFRLEVQGQPVVALVVQGMYYVCCFCVLQQLQHSHDCALVLVVPLLVLTVCDNVVEHLF